MEEKIADDILKDRTDFKLTLAKNCLDKISDIPYYTERRVEDFHLEFYAESFLNFGSSVIEILANEINQKFKVIQKINYQTQYLSYDRIILEDDDLLVKTLNKGGAVSKEEEPFSIYDLRDKLNPLDPDQKKIQNLIRKYFEYPTNRANVWDFSNSTLWQLRELRNHVQHSVALTRNYVIGSREDVRYLFYFKPIYKTKFQIVRIVKEPKNYFAEIFHDLIDFRNEIRKIIPFSNQSDHYKNQTNLELNF